MMDILRGAWNSTELKAKYLLFFCLGAFSTIIVLCVSGCSLLKDVQHDGFAEELCEEVLESYLDVEHGSIDLTPSSKEQ